MVIFHRFWHFFIFFRNHKVFVTFAQVQKWSKYGPFATCDQKGSKRHHFLKRNLSLNCQKWSKTRFYAIFVIFWWKNHVDMKKHEKWSWARVQNLMCKWCAPYWPDGTTIWRFQGFVKSSAHNAIPKTMFFMSKMCQKVSFFMFSENHVRVWHMVPFMRGMFVQNRVLTKFENLSAVRYQPKLDTCTIVHTKKRQNTIKWRFWHVRPDFTSFCTFGRPRGVMKNVIVHKKHEKHHFCHF